MALINCPKCGRENVSDMAEKCPECEFEIKSYYQNIEKEELRNKKEQELLEKQKKIDEQEARRIEEESKKQIKCPECGTYFYEKLRICPNCGFSMDDTENINKLKIIEDLKNEADKKTWTWFLALAIIFGAGCIFMIYEGGGILILLGGVMTLIWTFLAWSFAQDKVENKNKLNLALDDYQTYKEKYGNKRPIQSVEITLKDMKEIQRVRENRGVKCPYCSSTNIKNISGTSRLASAVTFGILSKKIGKQWHCNNCKSDF
ncbi:MAG: hypothetical protein EOM34_07110 [Clostridia bacterium]|nr:zinc ribbon domain-containing protein [Lachnospiraceae bacterium]NCC00436.1 hypothetical protein [Clostridia bacterium]NCD04014.1 hypothetical protein [Clostridia bacterium]